MTIFQSTFEMVLCVSLAATHYYSIAMYCSSPVALPRLEFCNVSKVLFAEKGKLTKMCKIKQVTTGQWVMMHFV